MISSYPSVPAPIEPQRSLTKTAAAGALLLAVGAVVYALLAPRERKQVLTAAGLLITAAAGLQRL